MAVWDVRTPGPKRFEPPGIGKFITLAPSFLISCCLPCFIVFCFILQCGTSKEHVYDTNMLTYGAGMFRIMNITYLGECVSTVTWMVQLEFHLVLAKTYFGRCTCRTCSANSREIWTQPQQICEGMSPRQIETLEKYVPDSHDISAPRRCGRGCLLLHPEGVCCPNKYHCAELECGPEVSHGGAKLLETYRAHLRLGHYNKWSFSSTIYFKW